MTRTNRQHVLNLADDGGAHVFEHDTAAASAVGSEYVAPDPQQPATYDAAASPRVPAPGQGTGDTYATPGFGDPPIPIVMMNPAFGGGGGGGEGGQTASPSANIRQMNDKSRTDRKMHYGLLFGVAAAIGIAIYAAAAADSAGTSTGSVATTMAEESAADPALPALAARVQAMEASMTAQNAIIARLIRTNLEQASTIAALQDRATGHDAAITPLQANASGQETAIASLREAVTAIAGQDSASAITALQANASSQESAIASLSAGIAAATASAASAGVNFCGGVTLSSDAELEVLAPHLQACTGIFDLTVRSGVSNATALAAAFANLQLVATHITMNANPNLTSLGSAFSRLQSAGSISISSNPNLVSLGAAFPQLQTVVNRLQIASNPNLVSLGDAFPQLQTTGSLAVDNAPSNRRFFASANATLCPTTTNYENGPAQTACNAYCATAGC